MQFVSYLLGDKGLQIWAERTLFQVIHKTIITPHQAPTIHRGDHRVSTFSLRQGCIIPSTAIAPTSMPLQPVPAATLLLFKRPHILPGICFRPLSSFWKQKRRTQRSREVKRKKGWRKGKKTNQSEGQPEENQQDAHACPSEHAQWSSCTWVGKGAKILFSLIGLLDRIISGALNPTGVMQRPSNI